MTGEPPEVRGRRREESAREPTPAPAPRRLELVLSEPPPAPDSSEIAIRESDPSVPKTPAPTPAPIAEPEPIPAPAVPRAEPVPFAKSEARMVRSLAGWLGVTGLATLAICGVFAAQWAQGRGSVPSAALAVISGAIGLWSLLAGWHFGRVVRRHRDERTADALHQLVSAFGHLRSILILKAIGLFLVLGLSCFAFSIVASLLALL
ncbi:hypothetical protein [Sandaracinus amylolyticus]|uniref:hypothetical protein n=1 Tax=Sandaracinus amylolyticus TaxID=927083 RepID=UPI0012ED8DEE|nr:hypothetical protein [Sandaracinus amylolyticus]